MPKPIARVSSRLVVALALLVTAAGGAAVLFRAGYDNGRPDEGSESGEGSARTLVVIVQGTYGNEGHWPTVVPGKVTFASELRRAAVPQTDVYSPVWFTSVHHSAREAAARELARTIDEKAGSYDRICLIGHSHGRNVVLRPASLCTARIDMVVCLSTPHIHLVTRGADGREIDLPVYCSREARQRIGTIVCVCPDGDAVPDFWADAYTGLDDETAISLSRPWHERLGQPRLDKDGMWAHVVGQTNVRAARRLGVADDNLVVSSTASNLTATTAHRKVHSRRMGYAVGALIRDGLSLETARGITSLVLTADEDAGEP